MKIQSIEELFFAWANDEISPLDYCAHAFSLIHELNMDEVWSLTPDRIRPLFLILAMDKIKAEPKVVLGQGDPLPEDPNLSNILKGWLDSLSLEEKMRYLNLRKGMH